MTLLAIGHAHYWRQKAEAAEGGHGGTRQLVSPFRTQFPTITRRSRIRLKVTAKARPLRIEGTSNPRLPIVVVSIPISLAGGTTGATPTIHARSAIGMRRYGSRTDLALTVHRGEFSHRRTALLDAEEEAIVLAALLLND